MDVAALVISIVAVLLSVIVAGWAIYLQWCMFRATTDQLTAIGKENASLVERMAMSLGQIHEVATGTRSSLDATVSQLVSGLLERLGQPAEAAGTGSGRTHRDVEEWRVGQAASVLCGLRGASAIVGHLAGGARDVDTLGTELVSLLPDTEPGDAKFSVTATIAVLKALDLLDVGVDNRTVSLTAAGRQVAARLAKAATIPESPHRAKAAP